MLLKSKYIKNDIRLNNVCSFLVYNILLDDRTNYFEAIGTKTIFYIGRYLNIN